MPVTDNLSDPPHVRHIVDNVGLNVALTLLHLESRRRNEVATGRPFWNG